ncbi:hypothetical protein PR048_021829 [Dryococelus australis]|uniref:Uncharacterized protein n=1 Tax=Dryococelus australis TaxID=614101 RepID=A0ABQ9GZD0_9NEOP|nr:hypothetical protein PR048_021829 [Dryococelus australis]
MDVQSVLTCPKLLVPVQYYNQKQQVHNFSVCVSNNKDFHLYMWYDGEGKVTTNNNGSGKRAFNTRAPIHSSNIHTRSYDNNGDSQKSNNNNHPYIINYVDHTFFQNYEELSKTIHPSGWGKQ